MFFVGLCKQCIYCNGYNMYAMDIIEMVMSRTLNKTCCLLTKRLCLKVFVEHFNRHWLELKREYRYVTIYMVLLFQWLNIFILFVK